VLGTEVSRLRGQSLNFRYVGIPGRRLGDCCGDIGTPPCSDNGMLGGFQNVRRQRCATARTLEQRAAFRLKAHNLRHFVSRLAGHLSPPSASRCKGGNRRRAGIDFLCADKLPQLVSHTKRWFLHCWCAVWSRRLAVARDTAATAIPKTLATLSTKFAAPG
jgi:hypothetical protein